MENVYMVVSYLNFKTISGFIVADSHTKANELAREHLEGEILKVEYCGQLLFQEV